ncbi:MAG TPA: hypothetical protein VGV37_13710 [Aliidongia sp.]|uniref:hypothetical protein n=1 Tax=Aliidongia sp. TaxID=1914230 RepID=UPI002DDD16CF|nr:hypothetical protein [Aliidongia sp.]HEV2675595.1 hypothetical protein [Aliidongia sp.]
MMIFALAGGAAEAGTLRNGTWTPTGCGTEPTPPAINGSGRAAYEASVKEANAYQQAAKQYEDCYFNEAQADNHAIGGALSDHQHEVQARFDKLSADSKAAANRLNGKKD